MRTSFRSLALALGPMMVAAVPMKEEARQLQTRDDEDESDDEDGPIGKERDPVTTTVIQFKAPVQTTTMLITTSAAPILSSTTTFVAKGVFPTGTTGRDGQMYVNTEGSQAPAPDALAANQNPEQHAHIDKSHTAMELGIAFGILSGFILVGVAAYLWHTKKGSKGKPAFVSKIMNKFKKNGGDPEKNMPQGDFFRHPMMLDPNAGLAMPAPAYRTPEMTQSREATTIPSQLVPSGIGARLQRRSTQKDLEPFQMAMPTPAMQRSLSRSSSRSSVRSSIRSGSSLSSRLSGTRSPPRGGLPIGGPRLPRNPSSASRNDPFADRHVAQDPFSDDAANLFHSRQASLTRIQSTGEILTFTDPRVTDERVLHITNGNNRDSIATIAADEPWGTRNSLHSIPPVPALRVGLPARIAPLKINRGVPPLNVNSHFSATTVAETPGPRKSIVSVASSDGPAQFRGINSWVGHQANRLDRHPEEVPSSAATIVDYDAKSDATGMDTRRTYYESER